MGCGKSKHSVETATTIIKSTNADGTKQTTATTATKTVKETPAGSSFIQKEAESCVEEDTNKKHVSDVDNVAPTEVEKPLENLKEDVKVKDSNPTENARVENAGKAKEVVRGDDKLNGLSATDTTPTSSKDDEVVKVDKEKSESTDDSAKIDNVVNNKMKESNLTTTDIKTKTDFMTPTKTEFMTPTLTEDIVGPFEVVKGQEEEVKEDTTNENLVKKTIDGPSNPKDNLKVEEKKLLVQATKVEAKKEDVVVTESDIAKAKIAPTTKTEKVPTANGAKAVETQEK